MSHDISVVTSYNQRISRNPQTKTVSTLCKKQGDRNVFNIVDGASQFGGLKIYLYHENSYDSRKFGTELDLEKFPNGVFPIDIFECWEGIDKLEKNWLDEFVNGSTSPFNKATLEGGQYQLSARYWFRKVAAIYHYSKICKTRYLLWLDSDIKVKRKIDDHFMKFVSRHEICAIRRPGRTNHQKYKQFIGSPPETGVICFDLHSEKVQKFLNRYFYYFIDGDAFSEPRWDDSWALGKILQENKDSGLKVGVFKNKFYIDKKRKPIEGGIEHYRDDDGNAKIRYVPGAGVVSKFDIYNDYFHHYKCANDEWRYPAKDFMTEDEIMFFEKTKRKFKK